jgi:twitching motility protein PilT
MPGSDGYYGAVPTPASPLDPSWTPAPQLQPADALDVAQPSMSFASAVSVDAPTTYPAVQDLQPPVTAPPAVPLQASVTIAAPVSVPAPPPIATTEPLMSAAGAAEEPLAVRVGAEDTSDDSSFLTDLLVDVLDRGCSDLHLTVGAPPTVRLNGHLVPVEDRAVLTPQAMQKVVYAILSQKQREKFEEHLELDFAYSVPGRARFRVNIYQQRDALGAAFRLIPFEIKPLEALGVPPAVANFAMLARGFVLVTGPTGSGKSTTLAAVVDLANRQRQDHIMTVEDPIEFLHEHKKCLVNQREVGEDTWSFQAALKHVLRQDPDIILVGEMRDLETIEVALTAAETGHLVMATLHTQDAAQTIDRVIDVFPPHQQQQVRVQLAGALQGVVCQQLIRTADGKGRVVATEVLVATPAIRNLIREGKTHQIYSAMQAGAKHGMATMDQHLADLVKKGKVTYDAALEKCHHVEDFNRLCGRA